MDNTPKGRLMSVKGEPLLVSDWKRALFMHFEVDAGALQAEVPFSLDLREGKAYVSLVAFTMRRLRPRLGGRLAEWCFKPIATHELLNLRTYVRHRGEAGIYFLAEWIPNRLSAFLGPRTFGLPYRAGRLNYHHRHEEGVLSGRVESPLKEAGEKSGSPALTYEAHYHRGSNGGADNPSLRARRRESNEVAAAPPSPPLGERRPPLHPDRGHGQAPYFAGGDQDLIEANPIRACAAGSLDEFLLERYTAFTRLGSKARLFRIWHPPWPQKPIEVSLLDDSLLRSSGSWGQAAKLVGANYSPGVENVWMGRPHKVETCREGHSILSGFYQMP